MNLKKWSTHVLLSISAILFCLVKVQIAGAQVSADVVATQGGVSVTLTDIDAFAQSIPDGDRVGYFDSPQRIEALISGLLVQKRLVAEAQKAGIDNDPGVRMRMQMAANEVLGKAYIQHRRETAAKIDFTQLAREDYTANKKKYFTPAMTAVFHILIDSQKRSEDDAKELAEKVAAEAKAAPDRFDALVEQYSDDPSKATNHGRIDDAGNDSRYVPEFAHAAGAMSKAGEIAGPVKTKHGYHVLKFAERTEAKAPTFEEIKGQIVDRLAREYAEKDTRTYLEKLRNEPLDANPEKVASLRERYASPREISKKP